jgi:hypothetical protein
VATEAESKRPAGADVNVRGFKLDGLSEHGLEDRNDVTRGSRGSHEPIRD